ncbi:hypothetical protein Mapa_009995 [Marchantia paleacea]|nr:hypothetical protein Mapa_009995 [Marchantia paleacea]
MVRGGGGRASEVLHGSTSCDQSATADHRRHLSKTLTTTTTTTTTPNHNAAVLEMADPSRRIISSRPRRGKTEDFQGPGPVDFLSTPSSCRATGTSFTTLQVSERQDRYESMVRTYGTH